MTPTLTLSEVADALLSHAARVFLSGEDDAAERLREMAKEVTIVANRLRPVSRGPE
jgi:hypothetical protein